MRRAPKATRLCRRCNLSETVAEFANKTTRICLACDGSPQLARVRPTPGRSPKHLEAVRKLPCCVGSAACHGPIHAHHVRTAGTAGTGLKPSDYQTVPLCNRHHMELHKHGALTFQDKHSVKLIDIADMIRGTSPYASA